MSDCFGEEMIVDINKFDSYTDDNKCGKCELNFITCVHCNGLFYYKLYDSHELECKLFFKIYNAYKDSIECLECGIILPLEKFNDHKNLCLEAKDKELISCSTCKEEIPYYLYKDHRKECEELDRLVNSVNKKTTTCESCKSLIPIMELPHHNKICREYQAKLKDLNQLIDKYVTKYPQNWKSIGFDYKNLFNSTSNCLLYKISPDSIEFRTIKDRITKHSWNNKKNNITNILRIENKSLYDKFYKKKLSMENSIGYSINSDLYFRVIGEDYNDLKENGYLQPSNNLGISKHYDFHNIASDATKTYLDNLIEEPRIDCYFDPYPNDPETSFIIVLFEVLIGRKKELSNYQMNQCTMPPHYDGNKVYDCVADSYNQPRKDHIHETIRIFDENMFYPTYLIFQNKSKKKLR